MTLLTFENLFLKSEVQTFEFLGWLYYTVLHLHYKGVFLVLAPIVHTFENNYTINQNIIALKIFTV